MQLICTREYLSTKNNSTGCGGMLPRKIFENLHIVMAILVLFEHFWGKLIIIPAHNFECFTKYDAHCSHSLDKACLRRRSNIVMKRFKIRENFIIIQSIVKTEW